MKIDYCAFHGLLVVGQDQQAIIFGTHVELKIQDAEFLNFIKNDAPFLYEIEGPRENPPIFEYYSTIIASKEEMETGCVQTILYCASSREENFLSDWSSWVAFEYHRVMPALDSHYRNVQELKDGSLNFIKGMLAFREEFDGGEKAIFAEFNQNNLLKPVLQCNKRISAEIVSFIMSNDRLAARAGSEFTGVNAILAKKLFDDLDQISESSEKKDLESAEFDRYGCCAVEVLLTNQDIVLAGQKEISEMMLKRSHCIVRWQDKAPSNLEKFLEGSYSPAPQFEIPYYGGGTGRFSFWGA